MVGTFANGEFSTIAQNRDMSGTSSLFQNSAKNRNEGS